MISNENLIEMRQRIDDGAECGMAVRDLIQHHIDANFVIEQMKVTVMSYADQLVRVRATLREIAVTARGAEQNIDQHTITERKGAHYL